MGLCGAIGSLGRVLVKDRSVATTPVTFDGTSDRISFLYESLGSEREVIGVRAITGSRSLYGDRQVPKPYIPQGALGLQPGPADWDKWLPRILGGIEESVDTFNPAETLPVFDMLVDRDNGIWRYNGCRVAMARIQAKSGPTEEEAEIVNMSLVIVAESETDGQTWPGAAPALATGGNTIPYYFAQGTLTLNSTSYSFDEFNLVIDNQLIVKHRNSLTPTCIMSGGRRVMLETTWPFTSATWTEAKNLNNASGTGSLSFVSGTKSLTASFPHLRNELKTPNVRGKGEVPSSLKLMAFRTSSNAEVTFVNDPT